MNKHSTPDGPFSAVTFKEPKWRARGRERGPGQRGAAHPGPELRRRARRGGRGEGQGDRPDQAIVSTATKDIFYQALLYSSPTSFWPRKAFVQVEDDFLHKVLYVTVLRTAHEHHPVVGEALHGGFFPHLGAVPQLQLHLHGTLRAGGGETAVNNRKATVRY